MKHGQEKHRSPKNTTLVIDWIHIVLGFLIVLMAVMAFLNPENHMTLFPLIFLLAGLLNLSNGIFRYKKSGHNKKKKAESIGQFVIAAALFALAAVSAVSIWGQL